MVIAGTTLERYAPTSLQPKTQPMTTSRALEFVGPAFPLKSLLTLGFIAELLIKFKNDMPFWNYTVLMAMADLLFFRCDHHGAHQAHKVSLIPIPETSYLSGYKLTKQ